MAVANQLVITSGGIPSPWYQTAASQQFGSLFSVSIPLTFAGDFKAAGLAVVDTIQSVAATATNRQGTSNAVSVNLK